MSNKEDIRYFNYAVAFVDVLGQREVFKTLNKDLLSNDDPSLIEMHRKTVMFIEHLRTWLESYFKAYSQPTKSAHLVPESKREQYIAMMQSKIKTHRFSDCFLAFTTLETEKYHSVAINGVFGILLACGSMMILSLSSRRAFRAAVDVGIGTNLSNGEVYGPVSYQVYELESKVAQYPRIVIGNNLLNYLKSLSSKVNQIPDQTKEDIEVCSVLAFNCLKMIKNDSDGQAILNYLGKDFRGNFGNELGDEIYKDLLMKASKFVEDEYIKWEIEKNVKLAGRYKLLCDYFRASGLE